MRGAGPGRGNFGRGKDAAGDGDLGASMALGERLGRALSETERRLQELAKHEGPTIDVTPSDEAA